MSGRLVVCPTPIGNLEDITLRVLDALRNADVVACEDTRHTRVLLERYGVSASLVSYHEHNERARAAELVERMRDGAVVALVSDAGMPLVSDPGYALVQGCVAAGLAVEVLPGPSSAITALVASALPVRRVALRRLPPAQARPRWRPSSRRPRPSSRSSPRAASARPWRCSPNSTRSARSRSAASSRSSTRRSSAAPRPSSRPATRPQPPKGEIVLVIGAAPERTGPDPAAVEAVRKLIDAGARPRVAASVVADLTGTPANDLYRATAT